MPEEPSEELPIYINGSGRLSFDVSTPGDEGLMVVVSQLGPDEWTGRTGHQRDWEGNPFHGSTREMVEWVRMVWAGEGVKTF